MPRTYAEAPGGASVRQSSCDWCSTTALTPDAQRAQWDLGVMLLNASEHEGEHATRWHAHGYSGWSCPGVALGVRPDSVHLRLSSLKAAQNWKRAVTTAENCTRFDTAVDLQFEAPVIGLARDSYVKCATHRVSNGRPPSRRLIVSGDGGSTFYTGSRASERMGRLYDKGVESGTLPAGRWWRWEVEFKGDSAAAAALEGARADDPELLFDRVTTTFFRERGAVAPPPGESSKICNLCPDVPTDERLLSWLATGVRPTVARLIERLGPERVTFSLGLSLTSAVVALPPETALN